MLDGAAKLKPLFAEVAAAGMTAVAMTDHGNLYGAFDFFTQAKATGIKPIIGIEAYVAPASRYHKKPVLWGEARNRGDDVSGGGAYTHMTLLAETAAGLRNLFGPENFFLELMDHGLSIERRVRDGLLKIGRTLNLAPLATNDSHYVRQIDATAHEALLCVQSGKTLLIAERIGSYDEVFRYFDRMPRFPVPDGQTQESWLRSEVCAGLARRFPAGVPEEYQQRADYELGIINQMGFPAYFLVVADLVSYAKDNGIRVGPGRGSATGCLCAYALGITELDPLEHKLLFERFLNPERVSMPDIDLDFDERRRGEVIRYVTERWGEEKVAQIVTYGTIKAKAAIKDASRVLGYPFAMGDRITKAMPPAVMGKDIPLSATSDTAHPRYSETTELRALLENDADVAKIFDTARGLEGLIRQAGVHAAGVILSSETLLDVVPIWRRENDGAIITQWDFPSCESIGLLKMDFLGLRNLTVLDDAIANIQANRGITVELDRLELTDTATFELLASGETLGVFQLDGGPMRSLLKAMAPTRKSPTTAEPTRRWRSSQ